MYGVVRGVSAVRRKVAIQDEVGSYAVVHLVEDGILLEVGDRVRGRLDSFGFQLLENLTTGDRVEVYVEHCFESRPRAEQLVGVGLPHR